MFVPRIYAISVLGLFMLQACGHSTHGQLVSHDELETLLAADKPLYVVLSGSDCEPCGPVEALVDGREGFVVAKDFPVEWWEARIGQPPLGYPSVVFFKEGVALDMALGKLDAIQLEAIVRRNEGKLDAPIIRENTPEPRRYRNQDLRNAALDREKYVTTDFSGSDLRGASFAGATLDGVIFSRADLTGVDFDNAAMGTVFWGASICPDGSHSSEHGYSCADHLMAEVRPPEELVHNARTCIHRFIDEEKANTTSVHGWKVRVNMRCYMSNLDASTFSGKWRGIDPETARTLFVTGVVENITEEKIFSECSEFEFLDADPGGSAVGILLCACDTAPAPVVIRIGKPLLPVKAH